MKALRIQNPTSVITKSPSSYLTGSLNNSTSRIRLADVIRRALQPGLASIQQVFAAGHVRTTEEMIHLLGVSPADGVPVGEVPVGHSVFLALREYHSQQLLDDITFNQVRDWTTRSLQEGIRLILPSVENLLSRSPSPTADDLVPYYLAMKAFQIRASEMNIPLPPHYNAVLTAIEARVPDQFRR